MTVKFGNQRPDLVYGSGNQVKQHWYQSDGTGWQFVEYLSNGVGNMTIQYSSGMPTVSFPFCTPGIQNSTMFNDGLSMGWGVVVAMFSALAIMFIAKALK